MEDRGPCRAAEPVSRVWPGEGELCRLWGEPIWLPHPLLSTVSGRQWLADALKENDPSSVLLFLVGSKKDLSVSVPVVGEDFPS